MSVCTHFSPHLVIIVIGNIHFHQIFTGFVQINIITRTDSNGGSADSERNNLVVAQIFWEKRHLPVGPLVLQKFIDPILHRLHDFNHNASLVEREIGTHHRIQVWLFDKLNRAEFLYQ